MQQGDGSAGSGRVATATLTDEQILDMELAPENESGEASNGRARGDGCEQRHGASCKARGDRCGRRLGAAHDRRQDGGCGRTRSAHGDGGRGVVLGDSGCGCG